MKIISFLVHCFTASGMIAVMLSVDAVWRGQGEQALLWLGVALLIDAVDGTLARMARVVQNLPHIDGAVLDHVIDYASYCFVPALMVYRFGLVPAGFEVFAACLILVASLYVFANRNLKTSAHDFRGFPALWNIVVFYMVVFETPLMFNLILCCVLSGLIFAPIIVLHPLRVVALRGVTRIFAALWLIMAGSYLLYAPLVETMSANLAFAVISMYFAGLCVWRTVRQYTHQTGKH